MAYGRFEIDSGGTNSKGGGCVIQAIGDVRVLGVGKDLSTARGPRDHINQITYFDPW